MDVIKKTYNVVFYDRTGASIIKTLKPDELKNELRFSSVINGAAGELVLDLNLPFDDFDEGNSIEFNNIVKIYENDISTPPRLIYVGFISAYRPYLRGSFQGVEVVLLGLGSLLQFFYFKLAGSTNFTKNGNVEDLMTDIIDEFNLVYENLITYDSDSVETGAPGVTINYSDLRMIDALNLTFGMAGGGWWWKIDEVGKFHFRRKPTSPTYVFTIAKDVERFEIDKSAENIVNTVSVDYDGGTVTASDAASITAFGIRERINEVAATSVEATAQKKADQLVADNNGEKIKVNAEINNEFDVETIKVGETCKFRNFNKDSISLSNNMQIVSMTYATKKATIILERIFGNFGVEITRFVNDEI